MTVTVSTSTPNSDVHPDPALFSIPCPGAAHQVQVLIDSDGPPGLVTMTATLTGPSGYSCNAEATLTVVGPDIEFVGLSEPEELDPGGYLCLNYDDDDDSGVLDNVQPTPVPGEDDLHRITLQGYGLDPAGSVQLRKSAGGMKTKIYKNPDRSQLVLIPATWPVNNFPSELWVEGNLKSAALRDAELAFKYTSPGGGACAEDKLRLTVFMVDLDVDLNNNGNIGDDDPIETRTPFDQYPGKWVWPNNDDSDGNMISDNATGSVDELFIDHASELTSGDIAVLYAHSPEPWPLPGWTLTLEVDNPEKIRVFSDHANGAAAIIGPSLPSSYDVTYAMDSWCFGFEGVLPGTTSITLVLKDPLGNEACRDEVRATVIGLEVKWETTGSVEITESNDYYSSDSAADPPPGPFPLGVKHFPDATGPGGGWNDAVQVRVRTIPPVVGVTAHLRAFDPDDPSANNAGNEVDADLIGPDNRGGFGALAAASVMTDAAGEGTIQFTLAHQPGDNHRVAATLKPSALDTLDDGNIPPSNTANPATDAQVVLFIGHILPLLTVWRQLHVETDSMVRPTFGQNTFTMGWNTPRHVPNVPTQVEFDVDDPTTGFQSDHQQFNSGYVELQDAAGQTIVVARVVDYVTNEGPFTYDDVVTVNIPDCGNGQSGLDCLAGIESGTAIISDDDLGIQATFEAQMWGCDDLYSVGGALLPPELGALSLRYHPAFIDPIHETAISGTGGLTSFLPNVDFSGGPIDQYGRALWDQVLPIRGLPRATPQFWTVVVVSAWQAEPNQDGDPSSEAGAGPGLTMGINTHFENLLGHVPTESSLGQNYTGVCAIFKGVLGEVGGREPFTVAHEIAHTLGLEHDPQLMCGAGLCQEEPFSPISLEKLRDYQGP